MSNIWGNKKSSAQMIIPPEQQQSMKRFLTPSRVDSIQQIDNSQGMGQSIQYQLSNKKIHHDESKQHIVNLNSLSRQFDMANQSTGTKSRMKLPKIRSMTLNTSYKYLNKHNSISGAQTSTNGGMNTIAQVNQSPMGGVSGGYQQGIDKLKGAVNYNSTIKEVTGEHFFTKYSQNAFRGNRVMGGGQDSVQTYEIDEQAKCICFCQQRLGRQAKCPHAESEDVDEISKIIQDQARDFLSADKHTGEDIVMIKEGLQKVEFVRSENYLSKLAVLISRQEKEIFKLQKKSQENQWLRAENQALKDQILEANKKLMQQNNVNEQAEDDKNFMQNKVSEKEGEMQSLLNKLREENTRSKSLVSQVKSQEVEIKTLLNCVENLRKQMMNNQDVNVLDKYGKYDDMMKIYADNKKMIEKIKADRTVEVRKDVFDMAMKKITAQAEIEMLNIELKQIIEEYAQDIDLKEIGLEI